MSRVILGIFGGAVLTALALAIVAYFFAINDHSGGGGVLGSNSDWWFVGVLVGLILGFMVGLTSSSIILWLNLSPLRAALFGAGFNLVLSAGIYFLIVNGPPSDSIKYPLYSLTPIGLINGLAVSYMFCSQNSLEQFVK